MRFASLGSGSRGNATLIQSARTTLLIDSGFSVSELEKRMASLDVGLAALDAILVTHEHQDHIRGVGALARKIGKPVWMTHGTAQSHLLGDLPRLNLCNGHDSQGFMVGDILVRPFTVPHDAREPVQFHFSHAGQSLAVLTDLGTLSQRLLGMLDGLDALLLEFNHDACMLREGSYPAHLKARVAGDYGHLSNNQAVELLSKVDIDRLRHLVCGHLSEKNNRPELVTRVLEEGCPAICQRASILNQDGSSGWFCI